MVLISPSVSHAIVPVLLCPGNCLAPSREKGYFMFPLSPCLMLKPFISKSSSVQFSRSVVPDILWPHGVQHSSLPCPSPAPSIYPKACPLSQRCHPTISSSVVPFFSRVQSFPASGSFPMSQFFAPGGQSIGVSDSTSVLLMNIQDWFPIGWTGWVSLLCKGLSRVFSNTTVQKHQFFSTQLSL